MILAIGKLPPFRLLFLIVCLLAGTVQAQSKEEHDVEILENSGPVASPGDVNADQVAEIIIDRTNAFRTEQGLSPVKTNPKLMDTARYFSDYMARTDRYGHQADDQRPSQRASNHDYHFCIVAENIAYQYSSAGFETERLANRLVEGWKNSPEHRENMLDPDVRDTGVAVAHSSETGHWYAVQLFGLPKSAATEFRIANQSETDIRYSIGDKTFKLPPNYARTHMRCRTLPVDFDFPGENGKPEQEIKPTSGAKYKVVKEGESLQVEQEK